MDLAQGLVVLALGYGLACIGALLVRACVLAGRRRRQTTPAATTPAAPPAALVPAAAPAPAPWPAPSTRWVPVTAPDGHVAVACAV